MSDPIQPPRPPGSPEPMPPGQPMPPMHDPMPPSRPPVSPPDIPGNVPEELPPMPGDDRNPGGQPPLTDLPFGEPDVIAPPQQDPLPR